MTVARSVADVLSDHVVFEVECIDRMYLNVYVPSLPYNARLCVNGHKWAKRQAAKETIAFTALDNGFATIEDPAGLQALCDRLGPGQIQALLDKWLAVLPGAFTDADRDAGYRYEISILQAEFSLTQVLDQPVAGRIFSSTSSATTSTPGARIGSAWSSTRRIISKGRHPSPGRFHTRVITEGVIPSVYIDYKHTSIKQYHKHGKALRTEMTINNTRDFGSGENRPTCPPCGRSAS
jgi:hypothetical protein